MKITPTQVKIRDLIEDYEDDQEDGVTGYSGALDIRPPYQRAFVYDEKQREAVIHTVIAGLPLNTMYWVKNVDPVTGEEHFEVLDGQQRTISICEFTRPIGGFSITDEGGQTHYFTTLPRDVREKILDYELQVYVCEGTDSERLAWFRVINTAGEKLTDQELLNANYPGRWLTDAKKFFSRTGGPAAQLADGLIKGSAIRQELLETTLTWLAELQGLEGPSAYMAAHHDDKNADELKQYYRAVVDWASTKFPVKRKERAGQDWGRFFNTHRARTDLDAAELEARISELLADDEVKNKRGVYEYVLTGRERLLNLRQFSDSDKATMFARQQGRCGQPGWTKHDPDEQFELSQMEADHIVPWSKGGRTDLSNGQMLCAACNREKRGQ